MNPLVSVAIPCFNQGRYLPDALESLRAQTFQEWECLVVDDGSSDQTLAVAARYAAVDPRIQPLSVRHGGVSAARNHALDRARGRYVQFLDADDSISPDKLSVQIAQLRGIAEMAVAYCDYRFANGDDSHKVIRRGTLDQPHFKMRRPLADLAWRWEESLSIPPHCFLFDARLFTEHGIRFDERLSNHEDWDCWLQVFRHNPRLVHTPMRLATYNIRPGTLTRDRIAMQRGFHVACVKQCKAFADDPEIRWLLRLKAATIRWRTWRDAAHRLYARTVPWPIQRTLHRWRTHVIDGPEFQSQRNLSATKINQSPPAD